MPRKSKPATATAAKPPAAKSSAPSKSAKKLASKAPKGKVASPLKAQPVKTQVVETPPSENVVVATEVEVAPPHTVLAPAFAEINAALQQQQQAISATRAKVRALEKVATRELKAAHKLGAKRKQRQGNRQPSGFVKPARISNELAAFLDKEPGTEMARTAVTREINAYIRAHNLQDAENGRKINPDASLKTLLNLSATDELTYFNLQKYMSPHFSKAAKPAAASVSA